MNMKKLISVILAALMALTLCGNGASKAQSVPDEHLR